MEERVSIVQLVAHERPSQDLPSSTRRVVRSGCHTTMHACVKADKIPGLLTTKVVAEMKLLDAGGPYWYARHFAVGTICPSFRNA